MKEETRNSQAITRATKLTVFGYHQIMYVEDSQVASRDFYIHSIQFFQVHVLRFV